MVSNSFMNEGQIYQRHTQSLIASHFIFILLTYFIIAGSYSSESIGLGFCFMPAIWRVIVLTYVFVFYVSYFMFCSYQTICRVQDRLIVRGLKTCYDIVSIFLYGLAYIVVCALTFFMSDLISIHSNILCGILIGTYFMHILCMYVITLWVSKRYAVININQDGIEAVGAGLLITDSGIKISIEGKFLEKELNALGQIREHL